MSDKTCEACGSSQAVDLAHIKSRGAGGDNSKENTIYLCRRDHSFQHQSGFYQLSLFRPRLREVLKLKGWQFVDEFGVMKLRRI